MDAKTPRPKTRRGRRQVVGSIKTGLHTVTVQMRRPSRFVPLMVTIGLGAFFAFGWPVIAWTQGPHIDLNDTSLQRLVDAHRGDTSNEPLSPFKEVRALVLFEALPATDKGPAQGSFVVLRESRVVPAKELEVSLGIGSVYRTTLSGLQVQVRRQGEAIQVLIGAKTWPLIASPSGSGS